MSEYAVVWDGARKRAGGHTRGELLPGYDSRRGDNHAVVPLTQWPEWALRQFLRQFAFGGRLELHPPGGEAA